MVKSFTLSTVYLRTSLVLAFGRAFYVLTSQYSPTEKDSARTCNFLPIGRGVRLRGLGVPEELDASDMDFAGATPTAVKSDVQSIAQSCRRGFLISLLRFPDDTCVSLDAY